MPRIRNFKDKQLYTVELNANYGVFTPLLDKAADLDIIEEHWDDMFHLATSLKERTASAHVITSGLRFKAYYEGRDTLMKFGFLIVGVVLFRGQFTFVNKAIEARNKKIKRSERAIKN